MRLVGASNGFIQTPFILEGVFAALLGSFLACGAVLAGASAGAMALAAWTWTPDGGVRGLGVVPGIGVAPHADAATWDRAVVRYGAAVPPDLGFIGLAERTGVIVPASEREPWRVVGQGEARWLSDELDARRQKLDEVRQELSEVRQDLARARRARDLSRDALIKLAATRYRRGSALQAELVRRDEAMARLRGERDAVLQGRDVARADAAEWMDRYERLRVDLARCVRERDAALCESPAGGTDRTTEGRAA